MGGGNFTLSKKELETKVVEMKFDNSDFDQNVEKSIKTIDKLEDKLEFKDAGKNFKNIEDAASRVDISSLGAAFENVGGKISAMSVAGITAISNLTNKALDAAMDIAKSLSVDQISEGYNKYESKTSSVQTLVNAGYELEEVNEVLDHLMWYSDETSYSFSDMTQALATAASQGLEIKDMIPVIEGMANATSFAGKGAAEFSRVIFNLMQSFGTGSLQLIDWKSVNLAGVSSERLKESLIEAAEAMGTIEKGAVTTGNFEDTLKNGWATTEVMMKAFSGWAEFTEEVYDNLDNYDSTSDAMEALSGTTADYAESAMKAAQSAKSFTDAIEATKDAVSTGWLTTFDIIFGNINEATALWTDLTNALWDVFAAGGEVRNEILQEWKDLGGRDVLIDAFWGVWDIGILIANSLTDAFNEVFPLITAEQLFDITKKIFNFISNVKTYLESDESFLHGITGVLTSVLNIVKQVSIAVKGFFTVFMPYIAEFTKSVFKPLGSLNKILHYISTILGMFNQLHGVTIILRALNDSVLKPIIETIKSFRVFINTCIVRPFLNLFKISEPSFERMAKGILNIEKGIRAFGNFIQPVFSLLKYWLDYASWWFLGFSAAAKSEFTKVRSIIQADFMMIGQIIDAFIEKHFKPVKDAFVSFKETITEYVTNAITSIKDAFKTPEDAMDGFTAGLEASKGIAVSLYQTFGSLFSRLTDVYYRIKETTQAIKENTSAFQINFDVIKESKVYSIIEGYLDKIKPYWDIFVNALKDSLGTLKGIFEGLDFDKTMKLLELALSGGFLAALFKFLKRMEEFNETLRGFNKTFDGFMKTFTGGFAKIGESITSVMDNINKSINVNSFKTVSMSILMLAAALLVLALIPEDKLFNAVEAISELTIIIAACIKSLSGEDEEEGEEGEEGGVVKNLTKTAVLLLALGATMIMMGKAMASLSSLDPEQMQTAVDNLTIMLAVITGAVYILEKNTDVNPAGIAALPKILMAMGVTLMAAAASIYIVSKIPNLDDGQKAVMLIGEVLMLMVVMFKQLKDVDNAIKNAIACQILVTSLIPLAGAMALFMLLLKWDMAAAWMSVGFLGAILIELITTFNMLRNVNNAIKNAVAVVIMTASLLPIVANLSLMALAIKYLGPGLIMQSVGTLSLVLFEMTAMLLALGKYSKNSVKNALALTIMTISFLPIVANLSLMSIALDKLGLGNILISIGILSACLGIMALTLTILGKQSSQIVKGAGALAIMSAAFIPIATALAILSALPWQGLLLAVGAMTAMLFAILAVAIIATKTGLGPGLIQLSGAFVIFSVGVMALAVGAILFANALMAIGSAILFFSALDLTIIAGAVTAFVFMLTGIIKALNPLVDAFTDLLANIIVSITDKLFPLVKKYLFKFMDLVADVLAYAITTLVDKVIPSIMILAHGIVEALAQWFSREIPILLKAAEILVRAIIQILTRLIPDILNLLGVFVAEMTVWLSEHGMEIVQLVKDFTIILFDALVVAIEEATPRLIEMLWKLIEIVIHVVERLVEYAKENLPTFLENLKSILTDIVNFILNNVGMFVEAAIEIVLRIIEAIANKMPDIIQTGADLILSLLNGINSAIENNKDDFIKAVNDFIYNLIDVVVSAFEAWPELFKRIGERIIKGDPKKPGSGLIPGIKNTLPKLVEALKGLREKIKELVKDLPEWFKDTGKLIVESIRDGLTSKIDELGSAITGLGNKIKSGWEDLWDINSPSKVMEKDSGYLIDGAVKGVEKNSGKLEDSFEDLGDSTLAKMNKILEGVNSSLDDNLEYTPTITPVVDLTNVQNGADEINGLMSKGYQTNVDTSKISSRTGYLASSIDANKIGSLNFTPVGGSENVNNITNNFTINGGGDPNVVADKVSKILQKQVDRRNATWA